MAEGNGTITVDPKQVAEIIKVVQQQLGDKPARSRTVKSKGRKPSSPEEKAARQAANDAECIKVFKAAGYQVVEPRFNVKTYNGWIEAGRLVRKGEKAHRVGPFNLFHEDQTSPLPQPAETKH